jgi:hypothetical protein
LQIASMQREVRKPLCLLPFDQNRFYGVREVLNVNRCPVAGGWNALFRCGHRRSRSARESGSTGTLGCTLLVANHAPGISLQTRSCFLARSR